MSVITPEVRALVEGPNFAHLATTGPDGWPSVVAVWVAMEGDDIVFSTGGDAAKVRHVRRDPRVAISIVSQDNPYELARIRGRVTGIRTEGADAVMDGISMGYTGAPFPFRSPGRVVVTIRPERVTHHVLPFRHTPPAG
ncbi:MAG: PPOX class F420-dependent oxidoreductase [Thermoleophilia bacterium]|jgi:PPOX class probable F420-dependent enzyme|nr:PPOX class F420-dependent oxidoreductase [Thermoleophilia bacterium]